MNIALLATFFGLYRGQSRSAENSVTDNNIAALIKEGTEYIEKIQNLWSSSGLFPDDAKPKNRNQ